ncbi:MAG: RecQ family ATP-dependent DNA helicase, partial [Defluviitaleaceae bacterium]|nr:RecQ family ATP-dependent DNA helicase [Defluviitaleaceae bacterium]
MKKLAETILKESYGKDAFFRDGQYEAIESTLKKNRTIVVQRTGWGKSLVYFTSTKLSRIYGRGTTIIISPLLVLMENQIEAAKKLKLKCGILNSTVRDKYERAKVLENLRRNAYDVFFISPETLLSDELQGIISRIDIGMFVIDECHCISDWGHDFRPEYGRLYEIMEMLPGDVPILGTTATANNRVVEDLKTQFGENTFISRGPLTRESMSIEIVKLANKAYKYSWLAKNIPNLPGSGIVYCLTRRDCEALSEFLNERGINARPYYSDARKDEDNTLTEKLFLENKIKVIVATIKLGMGYDKSDIGFVVHFGKPKNVVEYYQQIGRAGRGIPDSYCYLLSSPEDDQIHNYFIDNTFPTEYEATRIVNVIEKSENGIARTNITKLINIRKTKLERFLPILVKEKVIYKQGRKYYRTKEPFNYNGEYYEKISETKRIELKEMTNYIGTKDCLSKFIVYALDDKTANDCGKCANCLKRGILPNVVSDKFYEDELLEIWEYLNRMYLNIEPRKLWTDKTRVPNPNHQGYALAKYGESGYGELIKKDRESELKYRQVLVDKTCEFIREKIRFIDDFIITSVPSLRSKKVELFARDVADTLGIPYVELLLKEDAPPQKEMENSHFKEMNARNSFKLKDASNVVSKVILIDDIVDSRWTLTAC